METKKTLKEKLFELQKLHLRIGKNAEAWTGGKRSYKYATLDKIRDVIQDKMDELWILETSCVVHEEGATYVRSTIHNIDSCESLSSNFPLDSTLSPQDMGKVITYGRRYNLVALLNLKIIGEDDDAQWVGAKRASAPNGDKFVDTVIEKWDVEKARILKQKVEAGEYVLTDNKAEDLVYFLDNHK